MVLLTARGARGLVYRRYGWLGGRFFVVADYADDVLPPVDVICERRLTELAGLSFREVVGGEEYLLKTTHRWCQYDKQNPSGLLDNS